MTPPPARSRDAIPPTPVKGDGCSGGSNARGRRKRRIEYDNNKTEEGGEKGGEEKEMGSELGGQGVQGEEGKLKGNIEEGVVDGPPSKKAKKRRAKGGGRGREEGGRWSERDDENEEGRSSPIFTRALTYTGL